MTGCPTTYPLAPFLKERGILPVVSRGYAHEVRDFVFARFRAAPRFAVVWGDRGTFWKAPIRKGRAEQWRFVLTNQQYSDELVGA